MKKPLYSVIRILGLLFLVLFVIYPVFTAITGAIVIFPWQRQDYYQKLTRMDIRTIYEIVRYDYVF